MPGTRLLILSLTTGMVLLVPSAGDAQTRFDPLRINQLTQIIQTDSDEKRRESAIDELSHADPRLTQGMIQVLSDAMRKDPSPAVRLAAVRAIGRHRTVFVFAGNALEAVVESDSSPAVKNAAKQVLWEYHLLGYKSAPGTNEFTKQTAEPPLAKPAPLPRPVTAEPPVVPVAVQLLPATVPYLPPAGPTPGPRLSLMAMPNAPNILLSSVSPHPNLTTEPPRASSKLNTGPLPAVNEPPILPRWPEPLPVGTPHPYAADLPPIVPPPGPIPGVVPFPKTTSEPPLAKR